MAGKTDDDMWERGSIGCDEKLFRKMGMVVKKAWCINMGDCTVINRY